VGKIMHYDDTTELDIKSQWPNIQWDPLKLFVVLDNSKHWSREYDSESWHEMCQLLNYKLITVELNHFTKVFPFPSDRSNTEVQDFYNLYDGDSNNASIELIFMRWQTYKWIQEMGVTIECSNYANYYIPEHDTHIKVGSGNPSKVVNDVLRCGSNYYHVPFSNFNSIYKFAPSDLFFKYIEKKQKTIIKEMLQFNPFKDL
jgi:hypothetical protein